MTAVRAVFAGFDRNAMQFWHELAGEMSRPWFAANQQRYHNLWLTPMTVLLDDVARRLAPAYRPLKLGAPGVLRIHRDLRFARDKTPYKTHIAGVIRIAGVAGAPGAALLPIISRLREAGYTVGAHDHYKRLPGGFAPDHPRAELLKMKGLTCAFPEIPAGLLHKPAWADWLVRHATAAARLVIWLHRHVG